ncbi:isocitrate lyase/PEP mutase family protein [Xanthobacter sp. KR7-225]|uniref:isocitrate lyase/PEP mutase family protein n=1 Tax=Xanthobacter sp. KR7-225 TaxID=3156613 RepID=UPI0032B4DCBF
MRRTTRLKNLIFAPELLVMPGCFDPLSARIVEEGGYTATQCSGFAMSVTHLGLPDYSFLSMSDMLAVTQKIVDAVDIPVMADGDTGFGNAVNAWHMVRAFERIGCAGINIEDQVMPKRCGHLDGKSIVPIDEAVAKIRACSDARSDPDFVINARTDALAMCGIAEVIRRGNAYLAAGATMVFIDGLTSRNLAVEAVRNIRGPVAINLVEGGKSPTDFDFDEMERVGIARVSLPLTLALAAVRGMREALSAVRHARGISASSQIVASFEDFKHLAGFDEVFALERKYLAPHAEKAAP